MSNEPHKIKLWQKQFAPIFHGQTSHVLLKDEGYREGEALYLMEYDSSAHALTGRAMYRRIKAVEDGLRYTQEPGFVMVQLVEGGAAQ